MGVLTEQPQSDGLLADLLMRLLANGRQMPPTPALGGRVTMAPYDGPMMGNSRDAISRTAEADLRALVDQEPQAPQPGPMQAAPQMGPPSPPMQGPPMPPQQQPMPPMGGGLPPQAPPQPGPMQQTPQMNMGPRPQFAMPMQKPPQPTQMAVEGGWPIQPIPSPGIPGSGHPGYWKGQRTPGMPVKAPPKRIPAKPGLSESDLLNMQQLAMILARRQAAGG